MVVLSLALIPAARVASAAHRLDVAGAVTTASLMLAVYAIVNGNEVGWPGLRERSAWLAVAGGLLVTFLVIESRVASPPAPLRLFRLRNIAVPNVVGVLWAGSMSAWFFLSALYMAARPRLQPARGLSLLFRLRT